MVKNLPCNAGDASWGTEIPHATEQLSLSSANRVCAQQGKTLYAATKTQHSQIKKEKEKNRRGQTRVRGTDQHVGGKERP